ncbi:hypothetical protein CDAR_531181 [Caerostris darwini]|uniref:Uncharacterized protein n=1 Tax=Caerostris darwini TaxID=1538125 RepID=A0AAV4TZ80_9ARAC|nr:hypothetical protein CDAR_531181 [Caerostris darwini]
MLEPFRAHVILVASSTPTPDKIEKDASQNEIRSKSCIQWTKIKQFFLQCCEDYAIQENDQEEAQPSNSRIAAVSECCVPGFFLISAFVCFVLFTQLELSSVAATAILITGIFLVLLTIVLSVFFYRRRKATRNAAA